MNLKTVPKMGPPGAFEIFLSNADSGCFPSLCQGTKCPSCCISFVWPYVTVQVFCLAFWLLFCLFLVLFLLFFLFCLFGRVFRFICMWWPVGLCTGPPSALLFAAHHSDDGWITIERTGVIANRWWIHAPHNQDQLQEHQRSGTVVMPWWLALCDLGDPGWGDPWFPHSAVLLHSRRYDDVFVPSSVFSFVLFSATPIPELIQCYHLTFINSFRLVVTSWRPTGLCAGPIPVHLRPLNLQTAMYALIN